MWHEKKVCTRDWIQYNSCPLNGYFPSWNRWFKGTCHGNKIWLNSNVWLSRSELRGLLNCKDCHRYARRRLVLTKDIGKTLGTEGILEGFGRKDEQRADEYYGRRMDTEDPFREEGKAELRLDGPRQRRTVRRWCLWLHTSDNKTKAVLGRHTRRLEAVPSACVTQ